jgi:FAD synthase
LILSFARYLHGDIRFPSPDALVAQLKKDVEDTRRIIKL